MATELYLKLKELHPDDLEAIQTIQKQLRRVDKRYSGGAEEAADGYKRLYDAAMGAVEHLVDDVTRLVEDNETLVNDLEAANETVRQLRNDIAMLRRLSL